MTEESARLRWLRRLAQSLGVTLHAVPKGSRHGRYMLTDDATGAIFQSGMPDLDAVETAIAGTATWEYRTDDLETFMALDPDTRALVQRLIEAPTDADFDQLGEHPQSVMLAEWILQLPAYANSPDDDEEDD